MKTLIIAVNSKFIHSSLAVHYLKSVCGDDAGEIKVLEYTINDQKDNVLSSIYSENADIVAFSCYIWNYEYIKDIIADLKSLKPQIKIILGGPEVSYNPVEIMDEIHDVDYIIAGEGEEAFPLLLKHIFLGKNENGLENIKGLAFRKEGDVFYDNAYNLIHDLQSIPSPYSDEMLNSIGPNRILYYESSRGCPFSCSYCISSTFDGVRYFNIDRVKSDILKFIERNVKQVKFVDRTFNCNKKRANEILEFVIENAGDTNFHFEVAGDLFDENTLNILKKAPKGLIQFEIGIQTVNLKALDAISRKTDLEKLFYNIKKLMDFKNIHIHVDLIAGLPMEGYDSFKNSFNKVFALKAHQLQLGFLKLLKGSRIRNEADIYQYVYKKKAPYEILSNMFLKYDEIIKLKEIEELVERYYNSGKFQRTLEYLIKSTGKTPFEFFDHLSLYWKENGLYERSISGRELYTILVNYLSSTESIDMLQVNELLRFDFLSTDSSNNLPKEINRLRYINNDRIFAFLKKDENIKNYLSHFEGMLPKNIFKHIHIEHFLFDMTDNALPPAEIAILFDYSNRDKVTGVFSYHKISI